MSTAAETGSVTAAKVALPPRPHPPYSQMVRQAISELQDSSDLVEGCHPTLHCRTLSIGKR
ncbi:hypothetical protein KIN20_030371 [Parelaphostrongylus tenuis]|uniref:Uncharacterized protein n=1 Tax=Parelaphostrongylus tenuis TaxID=148309 RepID=A0AAD5R3M5_PARTN|nr:hypothetical protein KIN20_030371 [Parelaphostrongylus tenuis]